MKTTHTFLTSLLRTALTVLCLTVAACVSVTGPDGTDVEPEVGTTFLKLGYRLNGAGQIDTLDTLDLTRHIDSIRTTVDRSPLDTLGGAIVAFDNQLIRNGVTSPVISTTHYRYMLNGDVDIFQPGFTLAFEADTNDAPFEDALARVREMFITFPAGSKRDYTTTRFDSTVTRVFGTNNDSTQNTRFTITDVMEFAGPGVFTVPSAVLFFYPQVQLPHDAMLMRMTRTIQIVAEIKGKTRTRQTVVSYQGWYSPSYGYMMQEHTFVQGSAPGDLRNVGYTVLASTLPK